MESKRLNLQDLKNIQSHIAHQRTFRRGELSGRVTVHMGTCGIASGANDVWRAMSDELSRAGAKNIELLASGCIGLCWAEPLVTIELPNREPILYQKLTAETARQVCRQHVLEKKIVIEHALARGLASGGTNGAAASKLDGLIPKLEEFPFLAGQRSVVLRNRGLIDPEQIDQYIWRDGYRAAAKALTEMTPRQVIAEVKASGLRGRGGGGFPTGLKWEFCAATNSPIKYVLCNADEGDPGAFMDRSVMEGDPHAVLEGMLIAGWALSASQGYIYCRAEYPLAIQMLSRALTQARERGLLGRNILGTGFDFDIEIYRGAGAFVCGEETALMASIEGRRGTPRPRPPFPAVSGLWRKPSVLNNVETFASVPSVILQGGDAFAALGTESSKGTKVFALTGKVERVGLVEVNMGTSLGKIIFEIGGGVPAGKTFKAVQLGGPSGGCIPAQHLNIKTDYEEIAKVGAIMGSGGMIVLDDDTCMVDLARYFMDFCQDESCGKCTPCRVGTKRMLQILEDICAGRGKEGDIELLEDLGNSIKDSALCGLGQTAPQPVLSTIRYFREEYEAHIKDKRCPAGSCAELVVSPCQNACPAGMDIPAYVALARAGRRDDALQVMLQTNPLPSVCGRVCGHPCQSKCRRAQLDDPLAIMALKRYVTDHAKRPPAHPLPVTQPEKIAVVGAGPAGLTATWELRRRGYAVTLFDSLPKPGGMLRYGIPEYRLPRNVLDQDIEAILATGVELRCSTHIGRDVSLADLEREFDLIFVAVGAHQPAPLGIPGETSPRVISAVDMLRQHHLGQAVEVGSRVAVIGGGNTAVDAARVARRLGAKEVSIYYRRERGDMPALEWEVGAALQEGINLQCCAAPTAVVPQGDSKLELRLVRMVPGDTYDASGRRRPAPLAQSAFSVTVDTVLTAVGNSSETDPFAQHVEVTSGGSLLRADRYQRTNSPKIWAGGDAVTGPAMVIDAIRAGREAAADMDREFRQKKGLGPWRRPEYTFEIPFDVDKTSEKRHQPPMPEAAPAARCQDFREVELGFSHDIALAEARRCLRCDGDRKHSPTAEKQGGLEHA